MAQPVLQVHGCVHVTVEVPEHGVGRGGHLAVVVETNMQGNSMQGVGVGGEGHGT